MGLFSGFTKFMFQFFFVANILQRNRPAYRVVRKKERERLQEEARPPNEVLMRRKEKLVILEDIMPRLTQMRCMTRAYRDDPTHAPFKTMRNIYDIFIGRVLDECKLHAASDTLKYYGLVADKAAHVPPQKRREQSERDKSKRDAYASSAKLHHPGIFVDGHPALQTETWDFSNGLPPPDSPQPVNVWSNILMGTRALRLDFYRYLRDCMQKDSRLHPYPIFFDFEPTGGPYFIQHGHCIQKPYLDHRIGEADLACFHWARHFRRYHILVHCVDTDYIPLSLLYEHEMEKSFFMQLRTRSKRKRDDPETLAAQPVCMDVHAAVATLKDHGWSVHAFVLACIVCGTDFVKKNRVLDWIPYHLIFQAVHQMVDEPRHRVRIARMMHELDAFDYFIRGIYSLFYDTRSRGKTTYGKRPKEGISFAEAEAQNKRYLPLQVKSRDQLSIQQTKRVKLPPLRDLAGPGVWGRIQFNWIYWITRQWTRPGISPDASTPLPPEDRSIGMAPDPIPMGPDKESWKSDLFTRTEQQTAIVTLTTGNLERTQKTLQTMTRIRNESMDKTKQTVVALQQQIRIQRDAGGDPSSTAAELSQLKDTIEVETHSRARVVDVFDSFLTSPSPRHRKRPRSPVVPSSTMSPTVPEPIPLQQETSNVLKFVLPIVCRECAVLKPAKKARRLLYT